MNDESTTGSYHTPQRSRHSRQHVGHSTRMKGVVISTHEIHLTHSAGF